MHPHEQLLRRFYTCFQEKDAEGMAACYHDDVVFSDPVFPELRGKDAGDMWRMLCRRGRDLQVTVTDVTGGEDIGRVLWQADYTYSETRQKVHNEIQGTFRFKDRKIVLHRDEFSLYAWASQALGLQGKLLGWLPPYQGVIRQKAAQALQKYQQKGR